MLKDILSLSKKLISVPSTDDNPKALRDVLNVVRPLLKEFTIEEFESNGKPSLLVYKEKKRPSKFKILLNGHLDVVPANPSQFNPFEKDGKLYGRGTYDMKAGAAIMILVFKELAQKLNFPLGLQLVTDEEIGGANGTGYQLNKNVLCDFIIAGENSNFIIKTEAKGILWVKITTKGITAHGAYPWKGENAIWNLLDVIEKLRKEFPVPKKEAWKTTINLAKIENKNLTFNKVPEEATAWLDIRFLPSDKEKVIDTINRVTRGLKVEFVTKEPAAYTKNTNPYVIALSKALNKIILYDIPKKTWHGGSDVRFYTNKGMAGVEFGPTGDGHHSDNEWVDIKSLETYYDILKEFLLSLS